MDKVDSQSVLEEIIEYTSPKLRKEGDFTLAEYCKLFQQKNGYSISLNSARQRLGVEVENGKIATEKRWDLEARRKVRVYWSL